MSIIPPDSFFVHGRFLDGKRTSDGEQACQNATAVIKLSNETYSHVSELHSVTCERCGALVEVDCREAISCPGDPDQQLFAPYMSAHRHYDLGNCYDREIIRLDINGYIRRYRDYHALANRLRDRGSLSEEEYGDRMSGVLVTLQRHLDAIKRLNELEGNEQ